MLAEGGERVVAEGEYRIVYVEQPGGSEWGAIGGGIAAYNEQQAGDDSSQSLCFVLRGPDEAIVGGLIGMISGFYRGWLDLVIMRASDLLLSFPSLLLAIVIVAIMGPGLTNTAIVIGVVYAPRVARMARGAVMSVKENDYVTAATALGVRSMRILLRHVLPNVLPTLAIYMSLLLAYGLLFEASLSFLGLGVQPPLPSWGGMLRSARNFIQIAPGLSIWPGFAIMYAVLTFFFLAEGLRAVLDPRLRDR